MQVMHVVGARPNFMKIAPIMRQMAEEPAFFQQTLVHTGQHYNDNMSDVFFEELELPKPDTNLGVGSGTHAQQTARVMLGFESVVMEYKPDWVVVVGDVNSTLACALVCAKLGIKVAHVEAGLRSFDKSMPEEYNRLLTDQIAEILFTPSEDADSNLLREGIPLDRIHFVGNVMIDTLIYLLPKSEKNWDVWQNKLKLKDFILVTLHRPANVDDPATLLQIVEALQQIGQEIPVIFPVHPRTQQRLKSQRNWAEYSSVLHLIDPLGYLDFLALERHASLVLTDSGGVQEETTYLGVPCLTVRPNTERPVTITYGTNRLVEAKRDVLINAAKKLLQNKLTVPRQCPPLWDGKAAERIVQVFRLLA